MPGRTAEPLLSSVSRTILLFAFPFNGTVIATSPVGVPALPVAVRFNCTGALWGNELMGCPACVSDNATIAVPVPLPLCQLLINWATSTLPRPEAASYPGPALYPEVKPPTQSGLPAAQATLLVPP